jgi:hypothetical protein
MSSGFSEALMLCVTVTGLVGIRRAGRGNLKLSVLFARSAAVDGRLLLVGLWSNERLELVANSRLRRNSSDKMRILKN